MQSFCSKNYGLFALFDIELFDIFEFDIFEFILPFDIFEFILLFDILRIFYLVHLSTLAAHHSLGCGCHVAINTQIILHTFQIV